MRWCFEQSVLLAIVVIAISAIGHGDEGAADKPAEKPRIEVKAVEVKAIPAAGVGIAVQVVAEPVAKPIKAVAQPDKGAEKPQAAAVAVEAKAVGIAAQNEALVQQYILQFRPILNSELAFIRQMCDLSTEQRPRIKAAGEAALKDAATQMADQQTKQQRQVRVGTAKVEQPNPRRTIRTGLETALKADLSKDQMDAYTSEFERRIEDRKQAAIMDVVARMDGVLYLTIEQRQKISESISANWQEKWEQWLMIYIYNNQYFPVIPENLVVPHLTAEQKATWNSVQKIELGIFERHDRAVQVQDDWWGDPAPNQAGPANAVINFF